MQPGPGEPPLSYTFAVALTVVTAVLLLFASTQLLGVWTGEVVVVLLVRLGSLLGLALGGWLLAQRRPRSVRMLAVAVGFMWLSVLLEGVLVWGDLGWFVETLTSEPVYTALVAALLLSLGVLALLVNGRTRGVLANNARPGHDGETKSPE